MKALCEMIESTRDLAEGCGDLALVRSLMALRARCDARELYVVLVGETSVGKTTLANTVLGAPLLPATPGATTGIPVELRFHDGPRRFECVHRGGELEVIDRASLRQLAVKPGSVHRLRVYWPVAEAAPGLAETRDLSGLVLVDAPGFNSLEAQHQDILLDMIPEADAVIFLTNYRNGVTAEDAKMLRLVTQFVDSREALHFGLNRLPSAGWEHKRERMQQELSQIVDADVELMPLRRVGPDASAREPEQVRIWSETLWLNLVKIATAPERAARVEQNIRGMLLSALTQLEAELGAKMSLLEQRSREGLDSIQAELTAVREAQRQSEVILQRAEDQVARQIVKVADAGRDRLYARACRHIDEASRLTGADSCAAWMRTHMVSVELERTAGQLDKQLREHARRLDRQLDDLAAKLDGVPSARAEIADVPYGEARDGAARTATGWVVLSAFASRLEQLGGAAGSEAGFVNLAKKTVSKTGRLFGKRFGRSVYDNMGRVLRKVGLNAGRATGIVVVVLVEAAAWLYKVACWKQKLLGVLQHTLDMEAVDEPLEDALLRQLPWKEKPSEKPFVWLRDETVKSALQALDVTRESVKASLARQEQVLAEAASTETSALGDALRVAAERHEEARRLMRAVSQESANVQA